MASTGQTSTQLSQSVQVSSSTWAMSASIEMASTGQASTHDSHPVHVSRSTTAGIYDLPLADSNRQPYLDFYTASCAGGYTPKHSLKTTLPWGRRSTGQIPVQIASLLARPSESRAPAAKKTPSIHGSSAGPCKTYGADSNCRIFRRAGPPIADRRSVISCSFPT